MTVTEDLLTMIARLYEMAEFYSPPFAKSDVTACYQDILELVGALDEAQHIAPAPGQLDLFPEAWPV